MLIVFLAFLIWCVLVFWIWWFMRLAAQKMFRVGCRFDGVVTPEPDPPAMSVTEEEEV